MAGSRDADLVVLAGLAAQPEIERAATAATVALIAFDGAQGAELGDRGVRVALPHRPVGCVATNQPLAGVEPARHAAQLVV